MFDLEKSIADWRKQMLAAGIKSPVPLEELECHLREEIEREIRSGASPQAAFENSARRIGEPRKIKSEFEKIHLPALRRFLAALWFAGCLWSFATVCRDIVPNPSSGSPHLLFASSLVAFIYAAGVLGSCLLFRGSKWGISIIRMIAALLLIGCAAQSVSAFEATAQWRIWCGVCAIFSAISIGLLHWDKLKTPA